MNREFIAELRRRVKLDPKDCQNADVVELVRLLSGPDNRMLDEWIVKYTEVLVAEFSEVVKQTANELNEHYTRQGCGEEEVLMRVNGALVVLGHIRARFVD